MDVSQTLRQMAVMPELSFYAQLALQQDIEMTDTVERAGTTGTTMYINPEFWDSLTILQQRELICHEVQHPALLHNFRIAAQNMDAHRANIAGDMAIYELHKDLYQRGITAPIEDGYTAEEEGFPPGQSMEHYYGLLPASDDAESEDSDDDNSDEPDATPDKQGDGSDTQTENGDSSDDATGGAGQGQSLAAGDDVLEPEEPPSVAMANEFTKLVNARKQAEGHGDIPGWANETIDAISARMGPSWRRVLRPFCRDLVKAKYRFAQPDRRHLHRGIKLPGRVRRRGLKDLYIYVDSSASHGSREISAFLGEMNNIAKGTRKLRIHLCFWDMDVHTEEAYTKRDLPLRDVVVQGRGGTAVKCVFEHVQQLPKSPKAIIITSDGDLHGCPDSFPGTEVLWVFTGGSTTPPFGQHVRVLV